MSMRNGDEKVETGARRYGVLKQDCLLCKILGFLAIAGALNWGAVGIFKFDVIAKIFGEMTTVSRVVYVLIGFSGLAVLAGMIIKCPKCKQD